MPDRTAPRSMTVLGCGWAFPVARADDGSDFAICADEAIVRQSIALILSTRKGERVMRPDFGCDLDRLLFAPNTGATQARAAFEVREALEAWEPRIDLLQVSARADPVHAERLLIDIDYRVLSTDNRYNLVYPFYLDRALA